jgi:flavodoxin I
MIRKINIVNSVLNDKELKMDRIGIFYGSTGGATEDAADMISRELSDRGFEVDVMNIADVHLSTFANYDNVILGASTWGVGVIQDDWDSVLQKLRQIDFSGKNVAFFGTGDQETYPDTFVDGMGVLYDTVTSYDSRIVGRWSTDGYKFRESRGVINDRFVGLALDYDVQPRHSEARIKEWAAQITSEIRKN